MKYEKPVVIIYDEEVMNEIKAFAASGTCKCGNSTSSSSKGARA